jgi:hypothetical protein
MQTIKRILSLILMVIYLSGCAHPAGLKNVPLEATPKVTLTQTLTLVPLQTPSLAATETQVRTSIAQSETISVTPQPTEAAPVPAGTVTLGSCQLDVVTQPPWPVETLLPNELDQETGLHMTGRPLGLNIQTLMPCSARNEPRPSTSLGFPG